MTDVGVPKQPLSREQIPALIAALGDAPETVIPAHLLTQGLASAWVAGDPAHFAAAVIQNYAFPKAPAAPWGFGEDVAALWDLLRGVRGWESVAVHPSVAPALGALMETEAGRSVRYQADPYYILTEPVAPFPHPAVRQLTLADLPFLEAAPEEIQGSGWSSLAQMLREGVAAGAVVDGRLVATAYNGARSRRYADIGVGTLAEWRGRGFATAAAAIVAHRVQEAGLTPVWTTDGDNQAAQRVRQKLGFVEVARLVVVTPSRQQ